MPTVLIIDDDNDFRPVIVSALGNHGFTVLEAPDGLTGMELALLHQPDLIVCDVNLGDSNGFLIVEQLKENPRTSSIPFVIMSGYAGTAGAWKSDPSVEYLSKPFTLEELVSVVEGQLAPGS